jgi:hypothetical protein
MKHHQTSLFGQPVGTAALITKGSTEKVMCACRRCRRRAAFALLQFQSFEVPIEQRAVREDNRTLWRDRDPELLEALEDIQKLEVRFGIRSEDGRRLAA